MSSEGFGLRIEGREYRRLGTKRTRCAPAAFCPQPSALSLRRGVTLVELLITAAIVATLSATFLGVSNLAMESGRAARTKSTIAKLHGLLMEKWAEYETRRVDINPDLIDQLVLRITGGGPITAAQRRTLGVARADLRLLAVRELMTAEIPSSWSDILQAPVGASPASIPAQPQVLRAFPGIRSTYLRRYSQMIANKPVGVDENGNQIDDNIENQGAECLYMIIMLTTGDGEARTLFSDQDIGDTDNDGALEFLDGWGRPIEFIRWAPGFAVRSDLISGDADADHDPFDMFRRDQEGVTFPLETLYPVSTPDYNSRIHMQGLRQRNADGYSAFRLVPLIYSAGSDGASDIDDLPYTGGAPPTFLDPYAIDPSSQINFSNNPSIPNYVYGLPVDKNADGDDNSLDNIHNHLQDNR